MKNSKKVKVLQVKGHARKAGNGAPTLAPKGIRTNKDVVVQVERGNLDMKPPKPAKQWGMRASEFEHSEAYRILGERFPGAKMPYIFNTYWEKQYPKTGHDFQHGNVKAMNDVVRLVTVKKDGKTVPAYKDLSDWARLAIFGWDTSE